MSFSCPRTNPAAIARAPVPRLVPDERLPTATHDGGSLRRRSTRIIIIIIKTRACGADGRERAIPLGLGTMPAGRTGRRPPVARCDGCRGSVRRARAALARRAAPTTLIKTEMSRKRLARVAAVAAVVVIRAGTKSENKNKNLFSSLPHFGPVCGVYRERLCTRFSRRRRRRLRETKTPCETKTVIRRRGGNRFSSLRDCIIIRDWTEWGEEKCDFVSYFRK